MQINTGNVQLRCPSSECNIYIHRDEILARLPTETKEKYYRFLVDANNDPNVKTCPRCSYIHKLEKPITSKQKTKKLRKKNKKKPDMSNCVVCPDCKLQWCFPCQAPWHGNATCKEFRKGDKLLRTWAQEYRYGQNNAQKCPHCKVYIEKKGGCDHMVCIHCGTSFCYRCGERYMSLKFLGNHTSRLSPFGCRYNFLPEPYGGYRYYKFRQRRKWIKRHRKLWPELQKRPSIIAREISTNTAEQGEKLPTLGIIKAELVSSSQESSDDSNSVSEEDVIAIGIQGEGSQKVEVLVHAQDQQGHSEEGQGHGKNLGKIEIKGQTENTDEKQGKLESDFKDQIQVTSESGGKVHLRKMKQKMNTSPVVMHVRTTNRTEAKNITVNQSELLLQKGSVSSRETTPDLDKGDSSKSKTNPDSSEHDASINDTDKKEKHKNELEDSGFVIEEGNAETKGCFVRIFGKKLPVVWEKEKEGEKIIEKEAKHQKENGMSTLEKVSVDGSLKRKKSSKSIKNQPDIVSCALIAEHKQKKILSLGKETIDDEVLSHGMSHGESCDKEEQSDPYYGLISADTFETPL
ncbi:hypothetical protein KUTeg_000406 [Tegillarca granosa]|uniref:RBR-type E3 ubiquitin transferase n=1 Tax=Tegillarca granosa TaxID=220873 RepID=A0ABQ9FXH0_TEGGR|nr:hypothetical protein KUTeg_000406 [Tegillarca granosa]